MAMKSRTHVTFDDDDLDELEKNTKPLKTFSNKKVSENEKPKEQKQGKKIKRKASEDIEEIFSKKPIKKKKTSQDSATATAPVPNNQKSAKNSNKKKKTSNQTNDSASPSDAAASLVEHNPKAKKKGKQAEMDVDSEDAKRFRDFLCFHCGESGHTKSNCPARTKINNILYVGNLPEDIKEEKLKAFLKPTGTVTKIVFVTNKETGAFKGFAYVTMSSDDEAHKAINMEDKYMGTRELIIQYPNSPKQGVCLNCNQEGHMKNECPKKNQNFCYSCGKMGHNRSDCPNKLTVDKKECFNCGEVGHISRECPKKSSRGGGRNRSNHGHG